METRQFISFEDLPPSYEEIELDLLKESAEERIDIPTAPPETPRRQRVPENRALINARRAHERNGGRARAIDASSLAFVDFIFDDCLVYESMVHSIEQRRDNFGVN